MNTKKITYCIYAVLGVLLLAAIVLSVCLSDRGKAPADSTAEPAVPTAPAGSAAEGPATTAPVGAQEENSSAPGTREPEISSVVTEAPVTEPQTPETAPQTSSDGETSVPFSETDPAVQPPETSAPEQGTDPAAPESSSAPGTSEPEISTAVTAAPETEPQTPETAPETTPSDGETSAPAPETEPQAPVTEPRQPETSGPAESGPSDPPPAGSFQITMSFAGDTQLADNYNNAAGPFAARWAAEQPSFFLEKVRPIFAADDYTLLNLECVISDRDLTRTAKSGTAYWYKGPVKYLDALTCSSVEAVSLANNHVGDYGEDGRRDTLQNSLAAGFAVGTYDDTLYFEKNGYTVAIICDGLWNLGQESYIINRLKEANRKSDFQIVYWHGGVEYSHGPENWQKQASYDIIDAGADLVIGNHSHVLQPMEYYKGVRIVYSLGNFCYGGMMTCENATIIYQLVLTVGPDGVLADVRENVIPCYVYTESRNNFQPAPMTDPEAIRKVTDFMNGLLNKPV